ncbi:MAG: GNAT family N-acetyltransferase [Bacillota bacterium]
MNEHGLYGYKYLDHYWTEPGRHPFLVRVGSKLAGFALVRTIRMSDGSTYYSMVEFFIMRKYRHQGIGQAVAFQVFDMFPGRWRVAQTQGDEPAQKFWQQVISRYTNGQFRNVEDDSWRGPIQEFEARPHREA